VKTAGILATFTGLWVAAFLALAGPHVAASRGDLRADATPASSHRPRVILWAWERAEDLSFIEPKQVGISYLVKTIRLSGNQVLARTNLNGLKYPSGTWLMACARIEIDSSHPPTLGYRQIDQTAADLAALVNFPGAKAVQLDFDAVKSQRDFYRQLLIELRGRLNPSVPISITALTSWCVGDDWISQLPVSEAVPMLFRMGPDRNSVLMRLQAGGDFPEPLCRQSAGISADEIEPRLPAGRRLYIFNPRGWTKKSLETIIGKGKP
jgi:hypothetical protein